MIVDMESLLMNKKLNRFTNYCLQFRESNAVGDLPDGFSLAINSIQMDTVSWTLYNGEIIIQGSANVKVEFFYWSW